MTSDLAAAAAAPFDVVVVGGGPSGSACAYWLARSGWRVCVVERKQFPREKTCGDGLTPRAVRQLADMGLEDAVRARGHRFDGLRAYGFGASVEMAWPATARFPSYGYTITRLDLDGLVAANAQSVGATVLTGTEAVSVLEPTPATETRLGGGNGVRVRERESGEVADLRARCLVVADGQNSRVGRELGARRNRTWPMGMALRGYYRSDRSTEPWIDSHLDIRDDKGTVVPGYGWIFPLGDGRINVGVGLLSTENAWRGVNTTKLMEHFVNQVASPWGLSEQTRCSEPTGGKLPMGLSIGPRVGPNTLLVGDAAASINPFNGEGIAYGYETGRMAAATIAGALAADDLSRLARYDDDITAAYGDYFAVARAFVRVIAHPEILAGCVTAGLRAPPLMRTLLAIMANLMRNERRGPAEVGYRALAALAKALPEEALSALTSEPAA